MLAFARRGPCWRGWPQQQAALPKVNKDLSAVIDRNGKLYSVRFMTWNRDTKTPKIALFFEIDIDDIPSASAGPAVDVQS
jgi:hypothetical protein